MLVQRGVIAIRVTDWIGKLCRTLECMTCAAVMMLSVTCSQLQAHLRGSGTIQDCGLLANKASATTLGSHAGAGDHKLLAGQAH